MKGVKSLVLLFVFCVTAVSQLKGEHNLERIADDARFNNAYYFYSLGEYEKAVMYLAEYVEVYQNGIHRKTALMTIGDIYYDEKEYQRSIVYYMMLFEEYPNSEEGVEAYYRSGLAYIKMGYTKKARAIFDNISENYSDYSASQKARLQDDIESILSEM